MGSPLLSREKWNSHHEPRGSKRCVAHGHIDASGDAGRTATGTVALGSTTTSEPIPRIAPELRGDGGLYRGLTKLTLSEMVVIYTGAIGERVAEKSRK